MTMESAVDHDVVVVDEFDALAIEVKTSPTIESVNSVAPIPAKYPAKLHARKVAAELNVSDGLVFLPGEPSREYEDSDMGPAFRQRRYFYYLSGANFADCAVPLSGEFLREMADVRVDLTSLQPAVDQARVVKTEYEVAMIRKANAVSAAAHRRVAERLLHLENEAEIEAIFQARCTNAGTRDQAYAIIAGSGPNAGTLH
uniref:Xaa-Pro aminopeptidase n=1 Tax=Colletotrichum fructicola (strain Nara gc5) TaxID=1213859 RepID=L2FV31_COLFN